MCVNRKIYFKKFLCGIINISKLILLYFCMFSVKKAKRKNEMKLFDISFNITLIITVIKTVSNNCNTITALITFM